MNEMKIGKLNDCTMDNIAKSARVYYRAIEDDVAAIVGRYMRLLGRAYGRLGSANLISVITPSEVKQSESALLIRYGRRD